MRTRNIVIALAAATMTAYNLAVPALADHGTREHTNNLHALGHSLHEATFFGALDKDRTINSDIAFWGNIAFNGNYDGFRIIDISAPGNPKEIYHQSCVGDQGDIVVYENILVRSWNSKKPENRQCDGQVVPPGWEGVHVFDVSDLTDPELVASVELACGSHTVTLAPDLDNNRLIVYSNNSSSSGCTGGDPAGDFIDIIEVPMDNPAGSSLLRREPLAGPTTAVATGCHDMGVILGDVNLAACASADTVNVFSVGAPRGGTLEDPKPLYTIEEPGVGQAGTNGRWHSATFTWDGEVLVLGWEPGGGALGECEETDPDVDKSAFFYSAKDGTKLGQWVLPNAQKATENCTIHNYNVVPLKTGRYVMVSGNYQAGTWITDFTDPADPKTLGWSDPEPLPQVETPGGVLVDELGGAWSSYWYNGFIFESSITEGLLVFRYSGKELAAPVKLTHLNPQTQEFSLN